MIVDARFQAVADAFRDNFTVRGDVGAAACVYVDGRCVVDVWDGVADLRTNRRWERGTAAPLYSTTKGITALAALCLVGRGRLELDAPVWRGAPATLRMALAHTAGWAALDRQLEPADLLDWIGMVGVIEAQPSNWEPGTAVGYHARTFGYIVGEAMRRVDGRTPGRFLADEITRRRGLECWIGLPAAELDAGRVARLIDSDIQAPDDTTGPLGERVFYNPPLSTQSWNQPTMLRAEIPSLNGVATARALAALYADPPVPAALVDEARTEHGAGDDLVLGRWSSFGLGFELPVSTEPMLGPGSYGHAGSGGSFAWVSPGAGSVIAYVCNAMQSHPGRDPRRVALVDAVLSSLGPSTQG